jgi:oligosaccharide repeat unit polymerase
MINGTMQHRIILRVIKIAILFALTFLTLIPGFENFSLTLWLIIAFSLVNEIDDLRRIYRVLPLIWWLGILFTLIPLFFYTTYRVGVENTEFHAHFTYLICVTFILVPIALFTKPQQTEGDQDQSGRSLNAGKWISVSLLSMSTGISTYSLVTFGNPYLSSNPEQARLSLEGMPGSLTTLAVVFLLIGGAMTGLSLTAKKNGLISKVIQSAVFFVTLLAIGLTGTRLVVIQALVVFIASLYGSKRRRISYPTLIIGGSMILLILGAIGQSRYVGNEQTLIEAIGSRLSVNVQVSGVLLQHFADLPSWHGQALLTPFETYLPGNQDGLGKVLKGLLGLDFSGGGVATPLPLEGYLDFGPIGIPFYGFLAGLWIVFVNNYILKLNLDRQATLVISVTSGVAASGILGGMGTTIAMYQIPLIVVLYSLYRLKGPRIGFKSINRDHANDD